MSTCTTGNDYDGNIGLRISSIFVILIGSLGGALFPLIAKKFQGAGIPDWVFFIAKYFGSGVIIATAFIHVSVILNWLANSPLSYSLRPMML
jgi:zinc transporter 1/2/3